MSLRPQIEGVRHIVIGCEQSPLSDRIFLNRVDIANNDLLGIFRHQFGNLFLLNL